jgi:hypothetical protein
MWLTPDPVDRVEDGLDERRQGPGHSRAQADAEAPARATDSDDPTPEREPPDERRHADDLSEGEGVRRARPELVVAADQAVEGEVDHFAGPEAARGVDDHDPAVRRHAEQVVDVQLSDDPQASVWGEPRLEGGDGRDRRPVIVAIGRAADEDLDGDSRPVRRASRP